MVLVGDVGGNLTMIDQRGPKRRLIYEKVAPGSIQSFSLKKKNFFVGSQSKATLVYDLRRLTEGAKKLYEDYSAPSHVTAAEWVNVRELWTVGWKNFVNKHEINSTTL